MAAFNIDGMQRLDAQKPHIFGLAESLPASNKQD